jgi:two-component system, chemotaxis family, response regulator PixG
LEQKPDLIFLNLVMPITNGYELCSQIRRVSLFKETPIVILTGNDGIIDRFRVKMAGASDFISKPIEKDKIVSVIYKYLKTHQNSTITNYY